MGGGERDQITKKEGVKICEDDGVSSLPLFSHISGSLNPFICIILQRGGMEDESNEAMPLCVSVCVCVSDALERAMRETKSEQNHVLMSMHNNDLRDTMCVRVWRCVCVEREKPTLQEKGFLLFPLCFKTAFDGS